jgi:hypothetical protein
MNQQAFAFNKDAGYKAGAFYTPGAAVAGPLDIVCIHTSESAKFTARVPDIFSQYKLPYVSSNHVVDFWNSQPMQFWHNELNFAVWCATAGCKLSAKDHIGQHAGLSRALYVFHVYYQVRRILAELKVAPPQDPSCNALQNTYDRRAYERICSEFGVSPNTSWRVTGLGRLYEQWLSPRGRRSDIRPS